jgi:HD superfamily phosphohydrolase
MQPIWNRVTPPLRTDDIVKLAVGPRTAIDHQFSEWETILSQIIVGDAFGVDRMDYLLRDSHHVGVAYGRFDHYRLIDTLRILPSPPSEGNSGTGAAALGVEEGGLQSAEALMLARCFMFSQVYLHPIRRIYDIHLKEFLKVWLPTGLFLTDAASHLRQTDNELTGALVEAAFDAEHPGHIHARRIIERDHFKVLYERNSRDVHINPEAGRSVFDALSAKFGAEHFRHDRYHEQSGSPEFPVMMRSGELTSSLAVSETLRNVPAVSVDHVFCDRSIFSEALTWFNANHAKIVLPSAVKGRRSGLSAVAR